MILVLAVAQIGLLPNAGQGLAVAAALQGSSAGCDAASGKCPDGGSPDRSCVIDGACAASCGTVQAFPLSSAPAVHEPTDASAASVARIDGLIPASVAPPLRPPRLLILV